MTVVMGWTKAGKERTLVELGRNKYEKIKGKG